jgi:hypothetical protein
MFICEPCDFKCCKKGDYNRHLLTLKHKNQQKSTDFTSKNIACECGRIYKERSGLWRHRKVCSYFEDEKNIINEDLVVQLLKQNSELQKSLIELSKEKTITNNNTNNSHNKTFNFFLNETCKDALNISDFVSSIKPTLEDLEYTGRQGYVAGISNIIIKKLNSLEEYIRPIHCCDSKREILYIKENDEWNKESDEKPILTKAIKLVANENIKNIKEWQKINPHCTDSDSQKNNLYLKIVSNSMCGLDKEETNKNMNKIISNVVKEVIIEKG